MIRREILSSHTIWGRHSGVNVRRAQQRDRLGSRGARFFRSSSSLPRPRPTCAFDGARRGEHGKVRIVAGGAGFDAHEAVPARRNSREVACGAREVAFTRGVLESSGEGSRMAVVEGVRPLASRVRPIGGVLAAVEVPEKLHGVRPRPVSSAMRVLSQGGRAHLIAQVRRVVGLGAADPRESGAGGGGRTFGIDAVGAISDRHECAWEAFSGEGRVTLLEAGSDRPIRERAEGGRARSSAWAARRQSRGCGSRLAPLQSVKPGL